MRKLRVKQIKTQAHQRVCDMTYVDIQVSGIITQSLKASLDQARETPPTPPQELVLCVFISPEDCEACG